MKGSQACGISLLIALLAAGGCGRRGTDEGAGIPDAAIVKVGEEVLTEDNLANLMPGEERVPLSMEEKAYFIRKWVEVEVLYQEALRRGVGADPKISARVKSLEKEFLADHLVFLELRDRIQIDEDEVEAYFAGHEREYALEYRVSHILVDTYEEAEKVLGLLEKNSFAWVANRYSVDPLARRGGDLGYLTKGNMIPELETVIFGMQPGETSGIVKSDFGYHIAMLVGTREAPVQVTLADVREKIVNELIMEKRKKAYSDFMEGLMNSADIKYFKESYLESAPPEQELEPDTTGAEPDTLAL